ncbi:MAG: 2-hydroxyacyl-CoA dehydratase family protein [Proteobacteria bacterium]|nr:2-hydroxyacyl-CoA dehydratase family protein [Pseudomonadota bacterium]
MELTLLEKLQTLAEKNVLDIDQAKSEGRSIIGFYCLYSPTEIAVAANAIPLPLCGTRNDPIEKAEEFLPRNLCPLIKSSFGFAASGTCPYFNFSDMIVADTTCDGKKKMFELMSEYRPVHILQLPQNQDEDKAMPMWTEEVNRFREILREKTGNSISDDDLKSAISLLNRERQTFKALMDLARTKPSPISGMELLEIMFKTGFFADKEQGIGMMEEIIADIQARAENGLSSFTETTPRVLLTGVPIGLGCDKVVRIIEESGGNVVCFENCSGYKKTFQVDESKDPITALAEQYLKIPCSVMSPNPLRLDMLAGLIEDFEVDKVVDLTWQACHTYNIESHTVEKFIRERFNLPTLHLETDYSESDSEQLRTRIEAFLEIL